MDRENFYTLLELSIAPPENDISKIEAAIKKKQALWSRLRNHPTKGMQAKQMIDMLSEIKRVMLDDDLRLNELHRAKEQLKDKNKHKYEEIDRHIEIRMSKGYISEDEISKLAKIHQVTENEVRERIYEKEKEKFQEIDKNLEIRMAKGFISEEEIDRLSKIHLIPVEKIKERIKVPISKDGVKKPTKSKSLDASIEKMINDNLGIVKKSSLYEFLGASFNDSLDVIQKKAKEKETEILKAGKKDAVVTASNVLVGHCITIFKNDETKNAYDESRAKSHFAKLNSDIDIAGLDGIIRAEYFDILVKSATNYGMDPEEAGQYIRDYCKQKKWEIESKEVTKTQKGKALAFAGIIFLVLIIVGATVSFFYIKQRRVKNAYQNTIIAVEREKKLPKKIAILNEYLQSYADTKYTKNIQDRLSKAQQQLDEKKYNEFSIDINQLKTENNLTKAIELCNNFIKFNPKSKYKANVATIKNEILKTVEQQDFDKVKNAILMTPTDRLNIYNDYLNKYPKGKDVDQVKEYISSMKEEYYLYLTKEIKNLQKQEKYNQCIDLIEKFLQTYDTKDNKLEIDKSVYLKNNLASLREAVKSKLIFDNLMQKVDESISDIDAAKQILKDFLKAYPNSDIKAKIKNKMAELDMKENDQRIEKKRQKIRQDIASSNKRFTETKDNIILDKRTGLMWIMCDSFDMLNQCINFEEATEYVKKLRTGGYSDWRIPTPSELKGFYGGKTSFPNYSTRWFWSSKKYKRYSDGWKTMVDTISSSPKDNQIQNLKNAWECGAVRAVRSGKR